MPVTRKVEHRDVPISDLIPYERNPRKNDNAVKKVAASLEQFGLVKNSVVVDEDMVLITGHTTLKAMQSLGWTACPAVTQVFGLTEEEKVAYRIADNKLGELAEWDLDLLAGELASLDEVGFDAELTGFDADALAELVHPEKLEVTEDDYEPPVEIETSIKPGDIYRLGRHLIICGDSTDPDTYLAVLKEGGIERSDICFTSPPYNAGSLNIKGQSGTGKKYLKTDDEKDEAEYLRFLDSVLTNIVAYSEETFFNIGMVESNKRVIIRMINQYISKFKDIIYWKKSTCAPHIQPGVINNQVEFILCFGDGRRKFKNAQFGQGTYFNVIEGPNAAGNEYAKVHKATFPLYLPENIIENFCPPSGTVLEPFLGTGTTLIACEKLGRTCYGIDITPEYCQVVIDRWEKLTGQKAEKVDA